MFALDHQAMDDEFWARLRPHYAEDELADLIICCGMFLGLGRAMAVVGVERAARAHHRLSHANVRGDRCQHTT